MNDPSPSHEPSDLQQISNAMVRLYKELFGRGPTKARSAYAGPDLIVSTLVETLTRAEHYMVEQGEHQRLRDVRLFFRHSSEHHFRDTVEEITGRKVVAFISGMDVRQDTAAELFYLEPR